MQEISHMDTDTLYRHGMKQYGIRPSNRKNSRSAFEKKCVAQFREATGQNRTQTVERKITKKKQAELDKLMAGVFGKKA